MIECDSSESFDVVIAGAGLAGSVLATLLGRHGSRVALVDAGCFPRTKLCGEFLSPDAWPTLERLGVAEELRTIGYEPIRSVRLTTPRGRVLESAIVESAERPGIGISRATLDNLLLTQARTAGVAVFEEHRVIGPLIDDGRVIGLRVRGMRGLERQLRAELTIAADGRHSTIVRRTGSTRTISRFRPPHLGLKKHITLANPTLEPEGTVSLHLVPGGYVGSCWVESNRVNLCGLIPARLSRESRGDLDQLANQLFPSNPHLSVLWNDRLPQEPPEWKTTAPVVVQRSTPTLPGVAYVGDARGTVDPLGGQGMVMALQGAELLAPLILKALTRDQRFSLIPVYHRAWHHSFSSRIILCRLIHHLLMKPSAIDLASLQPRLGAYLVGLGFSRTRNLKDQKSEITRL